MKNLKNKMVYITGGSSGIGLALADAFIKEGASVNLVARNPDKLINAKKQLETWNRPLAANRITTTRLDITDHTMTNRILSESIAAIGIPDIMINCAGIARPDYFENISYSQFKETISVNLEGTWNVLSAVVPEMKKNGGHIVNVSSIAGFLGTFGYTAYSASKFAVIGLSETLRGELKPFNISVSVLCPPDTDTPGFEEENKTKPKETIAISGNVKLMKPGDIAAEVIHGIKKKKFLIIPGTMGKITFLLKNFFPTLVFSIMDKEVYKIKRGSDS